MLDGEKILITGATGKIAFPIARALAAAQRGLGRRPAAEPRRPGQADGRRHQAGRRSTCRTGDFSALPDDFSYVFHAAVDTGTDDWRRCVETNAQNSGELLYHCRTAKGFVFCSTGSIYGYQGQRPLTEADPPGVPLRANYSFSKVAARVRVHLGGQALRHPAHDHPHLLDVRPRGWRPGRPAGHDVGAQANSAPSRHSRTTTTRSTRTTTSSSASAPWRSPPRRRSS